MISPHLLRPGQMIQFRRPMVSFYPSRHSKRTTQHGPLIPRLTDVIYLSEYPEREGVFIAQRRDEASGLVWEIPFKIEDLAVP